MKIPMFATPLEKQALSKAFIAGWGLVCLGGYFIYTDQVEIGLGVIMNGLGYLGVRDKQK